MRVHTGLSASVRLQVDRRGNGDPVVFSHGAGATSATWAAQLDALAPRWAVTTWDLRGHGRSERPNDPAAYTRDAALGDLELVVRKACAASTTSAAVLVGHSLGGYLSLALAITRPPLVRGIVAIATGPGFRDPEGRRKWNENLAARGASLGVPSEVAAVAGQPDALVIDRLTEITVPIVVIVGERDRPFHGGAAYLERKLGARLITVAGAGHHVHETHPEVVNDAIVDLIEAL